MLRLIFGCGYLGLRVATRWRSCGDEVVAVTRHSRRAEQLAALGIRPFVADILHPETLADLPPADTVLFAVGFDRSAGHSLTQVYVNGLANVLAALPAAMGRLLYISSTGVYGQTSGDWVTEDSSCNPSREGGRASLAAETLLAAHPLGQRAAVLRLAGIYGTGRIPRRGELAAGTPLAQPATGFLNLIHVDDAAAIVALAAEARLDLPRTYNVSDGSPVLRADYYAEVARLWNAPPPTFAPPDPALPATARAGSDKRVSNARIIAELAPTMRYPSFREGLAAIVREEAEKQPEGHPT